MNCRKVTHLLSAYIDGELPGVEHRQIHEHLAQCADCLQEHRGLLQMKRMLASMRMREPASDLPQRILAHAHAQNGSQASSPLTSWLHQITKWLQTQPSRPPYLALAASLAVVSIVFASYAIDSVDRNDQIVWHPATPSQIAGWQPAPAQSPDWTPAALPPSQPVNYGASEWMPTGYSDFNATPRSNRRVPVSSDPRLVWPNPRLLGSH